MANNFVANTFVANTAAENNTMGNSAVDNMSIVNPPVVNPFVGNTATENTTMGNLSMANSSVGNLSVGNSSVGNTMANTSVGTTSMSPSYSSSVEEEHTPESLYASCKNLIGRAAPTIMVPSPGYPKVIKTTNKMPGSHVVKTTFACYDSDGEESVSETSHVTHKNLIGRVAPTIMVPSPGYPKVIKTTNKITGSRIMNTTFVYYDSDEEESVPETSHFTRKNLLGVPPSIIVPPAGYPKVTKTTQKIPGSRIMNTTLAYRMPGCYEDSEVGSKYQGGDHFSVIQYQANRQHGYNPYFPGNGTPDSEHLSPSPYPVAPSVPSPPVVQSNAAHRVAIIEANRRYQYQLWLVGNRSTKPPPSLDEARLPKFLGLQPWLEPPLPFPSRF